MGAPSTRPQSWGQAATTALSRFPRIWQITAYMRLLLANIATGQLPHCQHSDVTSKQITIPRVAGAQVHYEPPPQPKSWRGSAPASPPGSRATARFESLRLIFRLAAWRYQCTTRFKPSSVIRWYALELQLLASNVFFLAHFNNFLFTSRSSTSQISSFIS